MAEAARRLDQLHAILVAQGGETVLAEAPRGPGLDRAANVKSVSKTIVALLRDNLNHLGRVRWIASENCRTSHCRGR